MAVVVSKQDSENANSQSLLIDDGSGRISIRTFEEGNKFNNVGVGDFVLVVGRPREYLNEKYIVSEILKKVGDPLWVELRKLELESGKTDGKQTGESEDKHTDSKIEIKEEAVVEDINTKIFNLIKDVDRGEGADTQEIITKSNIDEAESIIKKLLEHGEVFEIKPGKLKVLE